MRTVIFDKKSRLRLSKRFRSKLDRLYLSLHHFPNSSHYQQSRMRTLPPTSFSSSRPP
ncbi:unnamed protein product [Heligmosomoides polygyrus]|uniref:Uncharacterized protein n=1 Tax=Heligmosomoides polygyrus TaxID=6339 RepID=A0A3P7TFF4_HELPZ|nr:unnamed protein product [Heligmosomoides polygyrus]